MTNDGPVTIGLEDQVEQLLHDLRIGAHLLDLDARALAIMLSAQATWLDRAKAHYVRAAVALESSRKGLGDADKHAKMAEDLFRERLPYERWLGENEAVRWSIVQSMCLRADIARLRHKPDLAYMILTNADHISLQDPRCAAWIKLHAGRLEFSEGRYQSAVERFEPAADSLARSPEPAEYIWALLHMALGAIIHDEPIRAMLLVQDLRGLLQQHSQLRHRYSALVNHVEAYVSPAEGSLRPTRNAPALLNLTRGLRLS